MVIITGSVGRGGVNRSLDVRNVQTLLNNHRKPPLAKIDVDGAIGPQTNQAIEEFQRRIVKMPMPDGRVDPGGNTLRELNKPPTNAPNTPHNLLAKPNWITIAEGEIGIKEKRGNQNHPRIIEYHATTGNAPNDETPWCSSFVNWVMRRAGQSGTDSALAKSWARWGKKLSKPAFGCVAVIDWDGPGPGWKGHVGFVVGKLGSQLQLLGGNQSDQVKVSSFGMGKIIAYVVPISYSVPESDYDLQDYGNVGAASSMASTR